jgi:predicted membrane metal-binding protein
MCRLPYLSSFIDYFISTELNLESERCLWVRKISSILSAEVSFFEESTIKSSLSISPSSIFTNPVWYFYLNDFYRYYLLETLIFSPISVILCYYYFCYPTNSRILS